MLAVLLVKADGDLDGPAILPLLPTPVNAAAARPSDREAPRRYDIVLMACCRQGESLTAVFGVLLGQRQPVPHDVAGERAYDGPVSAEAPG